MKDETNLVREKLLEAEQLILDFVLSDLQDPRPEIDSLKKRARDFLNGRLEKLQAERENSSAQQGVKKENAVVSQAYLGQYSD